MGSIKKKHKRFVRLPKEIAPILPYIAMAIPGMGPIAGNALLRYGLPQLLTAAGSAELQGYKFIKPSNGVGWKLCGRTCE